MLRRPRFGRRASSEPAGASEPRRPRDRRAEGTSELHRSAARYRSLIEVTSLDVLHLDREGDLQADIPRWRAITGLSWEQARGSGWLAAVHADDQETLRERWEAARAAAQPFETEHRVLTPDGQTRIIAARVVPIAEHGEVVEWVGTVEDVTRERDDAILRDQLVAAAAAAASRIARVQQVTATLATSITVEDVARAVLEAVRAAVGAAGAALALVTGDPSNLRVIGYVGSEPGPEPPFEISRSEATLVAEVLRTNSAVYARSPDELRQLLHVSKAPGLARLIGGQAWSAVPLATGGPPLGVLLISFAEPREFGEDDRAFVAGLAAQCAQALDRAMLYDRVVAEAAEAREASVRLDVLARATAAVNTALDADAALSALAAVVVPELADSCGIALIEEGPAPGAPPMLRSVASVTRPGIPRPRLPRELRTEHISAVVDTLKSGQHVFVDPAGTVLSAAAPELSRWLVANHVHTLLLVPLRSGGEITGVLALAAVGDRQPYDDADVRFAMELAARGAVALEHARLFRRHQEVALTLQRSLLPSSRIAVDELRVSARYLPGGHDVDVSGDWYDVIELGAGRVGLVIGDVMGRGLRAAAVMGQLRTAVRAYARQDLPPAELLELLDGLVADLDEAQIVTCAYAVYDPAALELCLALAGHPAPLLRHADGLVEQVVSDPGTPLGLAMGVFSESRIVLEPGAVLAFCTDGLIETRELGVDEGLARLRDALARHRDGSLEELADHILEQMSPTGGGDDVALLLIEVPATPESSAAWLTLPSGTMSARDARRFADEVLHGWGMSEDTVEAGRLLASELATNALLYGRPPVEIRLRHTPSRVVLEVSDGGWTWPQRRRPNDDDEGGRGLELVSAYAHRWGVRALPIGKTVWCELNGRAV